MLRADSESPGLVQLEVSKGWRAKAILSPEQSQSGATPYTVGTLSLLGRVPSMEQPELVIRMLIVLTAPLISEACQEPQPTLLVKKYLNTSPICIAIPSLPLNREEKEILINTPPSCVAVRLPFVWQYASHLYDTILHYFGKSALSVLRPSSRLGTNLVRLVAKSH